MLKGAMGFPMFNRKKGEGGKEGKFTNVLVVIPARAGSKRLPHKNVLPVGGIPLSQRTIQIAKAAGLNEAKTAPYLKSQIIVTTDDPSVKKLAIIEKIECIDRPAKLATDRARSEDAAIHAIEYVDSVFPNNKFDTICMLQTTSPCLKPSTLRHALVEYRKNKATALVAVNSAYNPCGAFYLIDKEAFLKKKTFWVKDMGIYVVSREESCDVDYAWDWAIANAIEGGRII